MKKIDGIILFRTKYINVNWSCKKTIGKKTTKEMNEHHIMVRIVSIKLGEMGGKCKLD